MKEPVLTTIAYFVPGVTEIGEARSKCCSPLPCTTGPTAVSRALVSNCRISIVAVPGLSKYRSRLDMLFAVGVNDWP
jgi:hypothetical protein